MCHWKTRARVLKFKPMVSAVLVLKVQNEPAPRTTIKFENIDKTRSKRKPTATTESQSAAKIKNELMLS